MAETNMVGSPKPPTLHDIHPNSPLQNGAGGLGLDTMRSASPSTSHSRMAASGAQQASGSQHRQNSIRSSSPPPAKLKRVDTQAIKARLATALGNDGKRYWAALVAFMNARISRIEFQDEALSCLKPEHVQLHNSMILGLLHNASAGVPGPSSPSGGGDSQQKRDANRAAVGSSGGATGSGSEEEDEPGNRELEPPTKRLRLLTAGLSRKERARVKNLPKAMNHSRNLASGATSSLGWAGAGADMLEKKRKEEEKRRSVEEKKRVKEVYTQIGAKDWKASILAGNAQLASVNDRLSLTTQQEVARALAAPLCVESKEVPDLDYMRDAMTLRAVEAGLPRGAQPQAAALLLAALQNHLQNVLSSVVTKIRANGQMGIRTTGLHRVASDGYDFSPGSAPATQGQLREEQRSVDSSSRPSPLFKPTRALTADLSSLSSSAASFDLPTSTSNSLVDSSMLSLASTAHTSLPPPSVSSEEAARGAGVANAGDGGDEGADAGDSLESSEQRREDGTGEGGNSLELRHLSFLFNVAPHTVVEPLGLATQERLLASDWTGADEDALREQEWTNEGMLLRESKAAATSKMNSLPSSSSSSRNAYIIDQLAPVRLFDRRTLMETQALHNTGGRSTKGGLSLPASSANAQTNVHDSDGEGDENQNIAPSLSSSFPTRNFSTGHHHHRGLDPHLYDVVDPVALLGSMAK